MKKNIALIALAAAALLAVPAITRAQDAATNAPAAPAHKKAGIHGKVSAVDATAMTVAMPRLFVDAFGALPLRLAGGRVLYLGFEERLDPVLALAMERMTGLQVECGMVRESLFRPAHARILDAKFPGVELVEAVSEPAAAHALARSVERPRPIASRLVKVHDCLWLRMWLSPQTGPLPETGSVLDLVCSIGIP